MGTVQIAALLEAATREAQSIIGVRALPIYARKSHLAFVRQISELLEVPRRYIESIDVDGSYINCQLSAAFFAELERLCMLLPPAGIDASWSEEQLFCPPMYAALRLRGGPNGPYTPAQQAALVALAAVPQEAAGANRLDVAAALAQNAFDACEAASRLLFALCGAMEEGT